MYKFLKHYFEIRKLNLKLSKTKREYDKLINNAKKEEKKKDSIDSLIAESFAESSLLQDEIKELITSYLIYSANRKMLPIPEHKNEKMWDEIYARHYVLSNEGISNLRSLIRRERKEKMELYLPWFALIIGLIGSIIGLISILNN